MKPNPTIEQQRRIDAAIKTRRQQIAMLQVEIARLEDTRLMLGILDQEEGAGSDLSLGGNFLPPNVEIAVRRLPPGAEDGSESAARKNGTALPGPKERDYAAENAQRKKRAAAKAAYQRRKALQNEVRAAQGLPPIGTGRGGWDRARNGQPGLSRQWREKVIQYLADATEPATSSEIANYYGVPMGEAHRKPLQNAMYALRVAGTIEAVEATGSGYVTSYRLAQQPAAASVQQ